MSRLSVRRDLTEIPVALSNAPETRQKYPLITFCPVLGSLFSVSESYHCARVHLQVLSVRLTMSFVDCLRVLPPKSSVTRLENWLARTFGDTAPSNLSILMLSRFSTDAIQANSKTALPISLLSHSLGIRARFLYLVSHGKLAYTQSPEPFTRRLPIKKLPLIRVGSRRVL